MSILNEIHLPERTVRRLGILLVLLGISIPVLAVFYRAVTWEPESTEVVGPFRPELVILLGGTFQMGSPTDEQGRDSDETLHEVTLTKRFALSRTEITQGQYFSVMGERPVEGGCLSAGLGDDLPVVCVDWMDAIRFCNRLSELEGLDPVYTIEGSEVNWDESALGYRLPTEAEWEYAARAGTRDRWAGTDDESEICEFANIDSCEGPGQLLTVGSKNPNRWYLFDMTGNAWEWVWDGWDGITPYPETKVTDPTGDNTASFRVSRGGSWGGSPRGARVAGRSWVSPSFRYDILGFRVARSLPSSL